MSMMRWLRKQWDRFGPARRLQILPGDTLPETMPRRNLVLMQDIGENWSVGMHCPCGCGEIIELMVDPGIKPHWSVSVDASGKPTLQPSVWKQTGCRSHFWVREGKIVWCP